MKKNVQCIENLFHLYFLKFLSRSLNLSMHLITMQYVIVTFMHVKIWASLFVTLNCMSTRPQCFMLRKNMHWRNWREDLNYSQFINFCPYLCIQDKTSLSCSLLLLSCFNIFNLFGSLLSCFHPPKSIWNWRKGLFIFVLVLSHTINLCGCRLEFVIHNCMLHRCW